MKNGITFTTVISRDQFYSGTWDPYEYRSLQLSETLSKYAEVVKIKSRATANNLSYAPIEYKDIPKGLIPGFNLSWNNVTSNSRLPIVGENSLVFGTMRAYLGNVVVTPKAEWLSRDKCWFAVNSEFSLIEPKDGFTFFWWSYLKSPSFLSHLPTGTGGTRPRMNPEQLMSTPVNVPEFEERKYINEQIEMIAKQYWQGIDKLHKVLTSKGLF